MPRKDLLHGLVVKALKADGWKIAHILTSLVGELVAERHSLNFIIVDEKSETIQKWIP